MSESDKKCKRCTENIVCKEHRRHRECKEKDECRGPRGHRGPTGPTGERGFTGPSGLTGSVAIYSGPNVASLAIDTNTVSGSTTATTWIHGRSIQLVVTSLVIAISSVVGTAAVTTAGNNTTYMIRLTILKLA